MSQFYQLLKVQSIRRETKSSVILRLQLPIALEVPFSFVPGQFVTIAVPKQLPKVYRCYSITNLPNEGFLELGIKAMQGGALSEYLVNKIMVGDELEVYPPSGTFSVKETANAQNEIVFIAGGSGITPIMSMLRYLSHIKYRPHYHLFYCNTDENNIIFHPELQEMESDSLSITHILEAPSKQWDGEKGFISEDIILRNLAGRDIRQQRFFICCPKDMMAHTLMLLDKLGVSKTAITTESYALAQKAEERSTLDGDSFMMKVQSESTTINIHASEGESILNALLRNNVDMSYSCRSGYCGVCALHISKNNASEPGRIVLSCQEPCAKEWFVRLPLGIKIRKGIVLKYQITILAMIASLFITTGVFNTKAGEDFLCKGNMIVGHETLSCNSCHIKAPGTTRQQLQGNVRHSLGLRTHAVDFGLKAVTNAECLDCHERENDRHPVSRFLEPRFAEARKAIGVQACVSCHNEHLGLRVSLSSFTYCQNCHQDTELKHDPIIGTTHKALILNQQWNTCLQCHDFHGNHIYNTPKQMQDTISLTSITQYLKGGADPYSANKAIKAKKTK